MASATFRCGGDAVSSRPVPIRPGLGRRVHLIASPGVCHWPCVGPTEIHQARSLCLAGGSVSRAAGRCGGGVSVMTQNYRSCACRRLSRRIPALVTSSQSGMVQSSVLPGRQFLCRYDGARHDCAVPHSSAAGHNMVARILLQKSEKVDRAGPGGARDAWVRFLPGEPSREATGAAWPRARRPARRLSLVLFAADELQRSSRPLKSTGARACRE